MRHRRATSMNWSHPRGGIHHDSTLWVLDWNYSKHSCQILQPEVSIKLTFPEWVGGMVPKATKSTPWSQENLGGWGIKLIELSLIKVNVWPPTPATLSQEPLANEGCGMGEPPNQWTKDGSSLLTQTIPSCQMLYLAILFTNFRTSNINRSASSFK